MAKIVEMTPQQEEEFAAWVSARPLVIQEMIKKAPPGRLYRDKRTRNRVTIMSYEEDGTVTVNISGEYNAIMFDRNVFGVPIDQLEECDLPTQEEKVGTVLKDPKEIDAFIDLVRPIVLAGRNKDNN